MTYGELRLRLSLMAPEIKLELIDGWIMGVYQDILDRLAWKRMEGEFVIQSPVSYATGTVAATQGLAAIVGTGTVFTAGMNGLAIRFNNQEEYYQLTVTNATAATLDRPYEGVTDAALTFRIDQPVFVMPANCRIIRAVAPLHDRSCPLERITPAELDRRSISRNSYGTPRYYVPHWDNFSDPPRMQLELYPIPQSPGTESKIPSWAVDYVFDPAALDAETTSKTLLPWVRPMALEEGCLAKIRRFQEKFQAAREHKAEFEQLVQAMQQVNALQRGNGEIRLAPELRRVEGSRRIGENPFTKQYPD